MKTYTEIESGVMNWREGDTIGRSFNNGDTRTDTDDEGVETIVDLWQEALDAGAVMLSDEQKAATLAEQQAQALKAQHAKDKMIGVEFDGVMCSATFKDQVGLSSVESRIKAGLTLNFEFENGNVVNLNADNVDAFEAVWFPFRMSFFS